MTKKLKEIVNNSKNCRKGKFTSLFIIPTGKKYNGFWGINGYNRILLLGLEKDTKQWCKITDYADVFTIMSSLSKYHSITFDIPTEYNCVRIHVSGELFVIDNEINISTITADIENNTVIRKDKNDATSI